MKSKLSSKHQRTLEAIFAEPTLGNITWDAVVALCHALGAMIESGSGSARTFEFEGGATFHCHSPHPQKEVKRYAIRNLRDFLIKLEITPW